LVTGGPPWGPRPFPMHISLASDLMKELNEGRLFKLFQARKEQRTAAALGGERKMMKHGQVKFSIHPQFYHYWGQRLGYECWDDPQFVHEFLRDNPDCRVKNVSDRIISGWRPTENVRFRKAYA